MRHWMRRTLLPVLALAGAVSSHASSPVGDGWHADPEDQYLLDLNIRQLRLGEGLRGYPTPGGGTCLVFGDVLQMLDVPLKIDLQAKRASGWAFREANAIDIDQAKGVARYAGKTETIEPGTVRETPEGWCVDSAALSRWLGIGVKVSPYASVVTLESEAKLPVELSFERAQRAKHLKKAALPLEALPETKLAYRMWRAPALDFIVSAGATYQASTGLKVDRGASVAAAGEIAGLSYDANFSSSRGDLLTTARVRAYRSDPEGGLLGPLGATHFAVGDVGGFAHPLTAAQDGRGVEVTNRPLFNPSSFAHTRFEGELSPGWQAELYRNGQLLAFADGSGGSRYVFEDVELQYGANRFEIVSYGPQGQQRSRVETVNVGPNQVEPGKTYYWLGANQPGRDLLGVTQQVDGPKRTGSRVATPRAQAAASLEHGLDKRTSVAALAATMLVGDERLTFVEGSVRRSIGNALVEVAAARQSNGGTAYRAETLAQIGPVSVGGQAVKLDNFYYQGRFEPKLTDARLSLDSPITLGKSTLAAHGSYRFLDREDRKETVAEARLTGNVRAVNLGAGLEYRKIERPGGVIDQHFDLKTLASGHIGRVRLRGSGAWEVSPDPHLRTADLTAYWSASERADWEVGVGFDAYNHRGRARISHIHRFSALAAAATVEAGTDGSVAAGINLNFSLDGSHGRMRMQREALARTGQVSARVFRDDNNNGRYDPGETLEKGAMLTAGTAATSDPSGADGVARVTGLTAFRPIAVGVDASSLSDPGLTPRKALQRVVPRPGVDAIVDIALVGAGDIEGMLVKNDGNGFEGLDVELIDVDGRVVATARTDFDGYFLFERAAYGRYTLRLSDASARAARLEGALGVSAELTPALAVVRLGTIAVRPTAQLAAN